MHNSERGGVLRPAYGEVANEPERVFLTGQIAAQGLYADKAPGAGMITGVGRISGPAWTAWRMTVDGTEPVEARARGRAANAVVAAGAAEPVRTLRARSRGTSGLTERECR
jgi:acetyl-CoA carboxylase carboxyltransferase component